MRAGVIPVALFSIAIVTLTAQSGGQGGEQQTEQQPTFVTGTQYVRVDLYVTRDGQLVEDLRPDEITLLEDGVPQTIDAFERIVFRTPDPLAQPLDPRTLGESRALAADPRSRVFVVFIDPWHAGYVDNPATQRRFPVLGTLENMLGPDDLVAVMTPRMRPEDLSFARGLEGLARLEGEFLGPYSVIRSDPGDRDEMPMLYDACFPPTPRGSPAAEMMARWREKTTLDALEALAVYLGDLREERKGVLLVTDGWRLFTPNAGLLRGQPGETPGLPLPIGGRGRDDNPIIVTERGAREVTRADQSRCEAERAALAQLDHRRRLQDIVNHANRSNVSFYPASPAGLTTASTPFGAGVGMQSFDMLTPLDRQSSLRMLAEATGGYAMVNTNNLSGGIARMIADSSAYYLLGYESTNNVLDGRYRQITVQVSRPGVQVRARPGYVAAPVPARTITAPFDTRLDPMAAALRRVADAADARTPLRLHDAAWSATASGGDASGGFWIVGEVDAVTRRDAAWTRGGTAEVVVQSPDGRDLLTTTVEVTALRPAFAVRVPDAGDVTPGEYTVRVRMEGSGALSRISETIRITVPADATGLGEAVLWRRGPSTGPQPVPTADPRFRRNERLRLELPSGNDHPVTARLLDRNGSLLPVPVAVSARPDDSGAFRWAVLDVVLAPLAPGDYVVEATQGETSRVTAFRVVP